MAATDFVRFLRATATDDALLDAYDVRNLAQVVFHATTAGYAFTVREAEAVIGLLEYRVATVLDGQPFDGGSAIWRAMWGRRYLGYLVESVVPRFTAAELAAVAAELDAAGVAA